MNTKLRTLVLDLFIILSVLSIALFGSGVHQTYSISPSFTRQEINSITGDEIKINAIKHIERNNDYHDPLDNSTNIERLTYLSTGKFLNATLWLAGKVKANP